MTRRATVRWRKRVNRAYRRYRALILNPPLGLKNPSFKAETHRLVLSGSQSTREWACIWSRR